MSEKPSTLEGLRLEREQDLDPSRRPGRWVLGLAVLLLAAGGGWWWLRPVPVRVVAAERAVADGPRVLLNASGYVTARREATVSSKITGKVLEVLLEEGQRVEAGQVLARLDDANVRAALAYSEAVLAATHSSLAETQVRLEEARRELRRIEALVATRIATEADLDRAQAEVRSLEARLDRLQADITVAEREVAMRRQELEDTIIRAPFTGIVTTKNAQPGEMISPISAGGGFTRTGIGTLVDMTSLEIEVDVGESYLNRVQPGQSVEARLDAYPDWKIPCQVIAIIPTADRQKATVRVRIGFRQTDPRILPNMSVRVAFLGEGDREAGVTVPRSALQSDNGRDSVWVVREGRSRRQSVTLGEGAGERVTIAKGLGTGEQVVVQPPARLREGARVRVRGS